MGLSQNCCPQLSRVLTDVVAARDAWLAAATEALAADPRVVGGT